MKIIKAVGVILFVLGTSFVLGQQSQKEMILSLSHSYELDKGSINLTNPSLAFSYQAAAPQIPFYLLCIPIPDVGRYDLKIAYLDSTVYSDIDIPLSQGLEKKNQQINLFDTSYLIATYNSNQYFPQRDFISFQPIIARDTRIQAFHLFPFKYLSAAKKLKVYTSFKIEVIPLPGEGINEITKKRNYLTTQNFYLKNNPSPYKYQPISVANGELLIVYRNTTDSLVKRFAAWKEKMGIKCHFLPLTQTDLIPDSIHQRITHYYDSIPDLLYLLLIGNEFEIPPYLYKTYLNTDYYSDSYYGMIDGNDFVPELLVGRFSGTENENRLLIDKTIAYEQYQEHSNYEKNLMLIASDQGENIGDDNETDWQHLRNIGQSLADSAQMTPHEYFDSSQGGLDAPGDPSTQDLKDGLNDGKGMVFYTGHGAFTSFTTGNFYNMNAKQLTNYRQLPVVVSAACDNGMFMNGLECLGEAFTFATKDQEPTGAVAFAGSSILMSWAPPMETQDEYSRLIQPHSPQYKKTLGGAFYNAQLSMLEKYPTVYGQEVMQTWILLGDPSLQLRIYQQGKIEVYHPETITTSTSALNFSININDALVTLSQNDSVIAKAVSHQNSVSFNQLTLNPQYPVEIVASKPNYQTYLGNIYFTNNVSELEKDEIKVFPNPTRGQVYFVSKSPLSSVKVFDITGRKMDTKFDNFNNSINLDNLSTGLYQIFIKIGSIEYNYQIIKE